MSLARKIRQLVVMTPNEVGMLQEVCATAGNTGATILHICASALGSDARFMLTVDRVDEVRAALEVREFEVSEITVIEIELDNVGGSLQPVATLLGHANIDIEFLYGTSTSGNTTLCVLSTNDNDQAVEILNGAPLEAALTA